MDMSSTGVHVAGGDHDMLVVAESLNSICNDKAGSNGLDHYHDGVMYRRLTDKAVIAQLHDGSPVYTDACDIRGANSG